MLSPYDLKKKRGEPKSAEQDDSRKAYDRPLKDFDDPLDF